MRGGAATAVAHAAQQLAVGDAGRDEEAVVTGDQVVGRQDVVGVEVVACVEVDAAVARAVDAGILAARLPRALVRQMESVA